jgi:hypothetical protein
VRRDKHTHSKTERGNELARDDDEGREHKTKIQPTPKQHMVQAKTPCKLTVEGWRWSKEKEEEEEEERNGWESKVAAAAAAAAAAAVC